MVTNVSQPTLLHYRPAEATAGGTAIIACPGGAYLATHGWMQRGS